MTISRYGISRKSAIKKATAPITGGISCPPVDATASTDAASRGENPARFIIGIVITPVATMLETATPDTEPNRLDAVIAILAEPPR